MDLRRVDLNLAAVFLAIWRERSVTRAGERLALSQAAVSAALERLRRLVQDPLFVRAKGEMAPTPRAAAMAGPLQEHLDALLACIRQPEAFDPARTRRRFVVGASDDYELALGPALVRRVAALAPGATIAFRQTNRHLVEAMLEDGSVELAVVARPPRARWIVARRIGASDYACLLDAKRCGVELPLSEADFLRLPHVLVSFGGSSGAVDDALRPLRRRRTVAASLTHFASVPLFLKATAAIATIPSHAATALARAAGLKACAVPIHMGVFDVHLVARRDAAGDQGLAWLGEQVARCAADVLRPPAVSAARGARASSRPAAASTPRPRPAGRTSATSPAGRNGRRRPA